MVHITRLVMQGFKSFAKRTEIQFDKGINVVLGPNGSGKSNVSDALCFVLGRLSIKSMRATKAKNLLFMGSKYIKPAREATVELVFDNRERTIGIERDEIILQRTVRANGQGIYKINGETKTRLEVVEMLAQAGIDPYGFNLVLQGQIQAIVKMHPEERRKIIEEVAGIAIYESRKEKSLKELEKTEERLKEVTTILRERTAFLKNLEQERQQALKYKELEETIKRCKASLLLKRKHEKEKEGNAVTLSVEEKTAQKETFRKQIAELQETIDAFGQECNEIQRHIQQATGLEQESLHTSIANLKAELEGLRVRKESYEHRLAEFERRMQEMRKSLPDLETDIRRLEQEAPSVAAKAQELAEKKKELHALEEERRMIHATRAELQSVKERILEKERGLARGAAIGEGLIKQLEELERTLRYPTLTHCHSFIQETRTLLQEKRNLVEELIKKSLYEEKKISVAEADCERAQKIVSQVTQLDVCPLCRTTITVDHKNHVEKEASSLAEAAQLQQTQSTTLLATYTAERATLLKRIQELERTLRASEEEQIRHITLNEKKQQLHKQQAEEKELRAELQALEKRRRALEEKTGERSALEERYTSVLLAIEEISSRTSEDTDTTLLYKRREVERMQTILKQATRDSEELSKEIAILTELNAKKQTLLHEKERHERQLQERFKQLYAERDEKQTKMQTLTHQTSELQSELRALEEQINYLKVGKAKVDAEREAIEMELIDYPGIEPLPGSKEHLEERLQTAHTKLGSIGGINMRALDVYDEVKHSYDEVFIKVQTVEKEKLDILGIIGEIDKKKKTSFMRTFHAMNSLFTQNFAQLYTKGTAYLELENKEDIFAGGVQIVVRLAKGKYFDATSLSGGEQTLVALSLLFAIQEYKPYHFYVFDEIDAALDKRNSERLAALLMRYMKQGQYIVITHNDAIIMQANVLYGVSMHDNASKVLSLNLQEATAEAKKIEEQVEEAKTNAPAEQHVAPEDTTVMQR